MPAAARPARTTIRPARRSLRRPALRRTTGALAVALCWALLGPPAAADVPVGWSEPDPVSGLEMLLVLVVAPVALAIVIALLAWLPGVTRGSRAGSGPGTHEDTWFGGPTEGTQALEPARDAESKEIGGASGRW